MMQTTLKRFRWKIIVLALVVLALLTFGLTLPAGATEFRGGEVVIIDENEVIDDDLFISAGRIEMNGTVTGDLFAVGSEVAVNGTVEGSLFISGQIMEVAGEVDGSLYSSGLSVSLAPQAQVGRNLYFGGFSLDTAAGSQIGRSLYAGGYQAVLAGDVAGDLGAGSAALELNGRVGGNVDISVEASDPDFDTTAPFITGFLPMGVRMRAPGLRVGPQADIEGDLAYTSPSEQTLPEGAVGGRVAFSTPEPGADPGAPRGGVLYRLGDSLRQRVGEFLAILLLGVLLLRYRPQILEAIGRHIQDQPLPSTGWGCLVLLVFFVAIPVAALGIFLTAAVGGLVTLGRLFNVILSLGGAGLSLLVSAFLLVISLGTKIVVAYLAGRLILSALGAEPADDRWGEFGALAVGALLYEILRAIPFGLGWLISVLVTLIGLGAMYFALRERMRPGAPLAPPAEAAAD